MRCVVKRKLKFYALNGAHGRVPDEANQLQETDGGQRSSEDSQDDDTSVLRYACSTDHRFPASATERVGIQGSGNLVESPVSASHSSDRVFVRSPHEIATSIDASTRRWVPRQLQCRIRIGDMLALTWRPASLGESILQVKREKKGVNPWVAILPEIEALLQSWRHHLRNASVRPPSTARIWPVVLLRRFVSNRKIASAWSAGVIGCFVNVRSA